MEIYSTVIEKPVSDPKISVVILSYNRKNYLLLNLRGLVELQNVLEIPLEIIVVDNNSTEFEIDAVVDCFPTVLFIKLEENRGAVARSEGMRVANGDIIITLDDDVFGLSEKHLKAITDKFLEDKNVGAINFKVLDERSGALVNWAHHLDKEVYSVSEFETYEISEGAVAFRSEILRNVGYYPPEFFISHEGPDLAIRILNSGYSVIYFPDVEVIHAHAQQGRESWRRYYYDSRNMIWLAARRYPLSLVMKIMVPNLTALLLYSLRDGFVRYYFKGLKDGITGIKYHLGYREIANAEVLILISSIKKKSPPFHKKLKERLLRRGVQI